GLEIMEALRGHTSGFAVPTYVIDAPGGGGKIPVMPNYHISQGPGRIVLRNYEGFVTTYREPDEAYTRDLEHQLSYLDEEPHIYMESDVQMGVSGLSSGQHLTIKPEGFDDVHRRGREGDAEKRGRRNFWDDYS
nr:lysine 2,3-aminomutase [Anaerolineae bacterium]